MPIPFLFQQQTGLAKVLNGSQFYAPRTSSITQTRGSGTPTITRATVATVMGYGPTAVLADGQTLLTVASGELRFQGGRRISEGVWSDVDANGVPIPAATRDGSVVEAAATNLCLQSQTLGTAPWAGDNAVVGTENSVVAPDGTMTMDEVVPSLGSYNGGIRQDIAVTDTGTYTFSAYVYSSTGDTFIARIRYFNTGTILIVDSDAVAIAAGETRRITVTGTNNGTGNTLGRVSIRSLTTDTYYQWGAQVELGSYATAYIPTTTAAVPRNKDVLDDQVSGNLTAAAGSVAFQFTPLHAPSGTIALGGSYVDANNYTQILHDATNLILRKRIGGVDKDATIALAFASGTTYKVAVRWGAGGIQVAVNGVLGTADSDATAAQLGTRWQWGADGNGGQQAGACFKEKFLTTRAWSDSEMIAVTA